jgi:hypothetical protein
VATTRILGIFTRKRSPTDNCGTQCVAVTVAVKRVTDFCRGRAFRSEMAGRAIAPRRPVLAHWDLPLSCTDVRSLAW